MNLSLRIKIILLSFISLDSVNAQADQGAAFNKFLDEIIISSVSLTAEDKPTLSTATAVAVSRSIELDNSIDPKQKGMGKFVTDKTKKAKNCVTIPKDAMNTPIAYEARNITLRKYLVEISKQAKLDLYVTSDGLVFAHPNKKSRDELLSADKLTVWSTIYKVKPIKLNIK